MSDTTIPPLEYSPEPPRPFRVVVEFEVLAHTQAEAQHMVDEVLIEDLAGPPDQLRTDGDRVFGEDFGDDVPHIRSWIPAPGASPASRVVPSSGWETFEESGIPEIVAQMFSPEPSAGDFRLPDGSPDRERFEDAHERWRVECLSLAVQPPPPRLPDTFERLERAERVRDGLVDLLEREQLPVEPVRTI